MWGKLKNYFFEKYPERFEIKPREEPCKMEWLEYKQWSKTALPWQNTPHCKEHNVQFQHCLSWHIDNDFRLERQINSAFNET